MHVPWPLNRIAQRSRGVSLAVALCGLLLVTPDRAGADELRIGGTGAALGTMQVLGEAFGATHPDIKIKIVPSLGTTGGIRAVAGGAIDLAVASRPLTEAERRLGSSEFEYGRTPFVFAVAMKSRVAEITLAQLAAIYAGRQATWPDGSPVRLVLRPASDSDSEIVRGLSPEIEQALALAGKRPGVRISITDQDAADDIERIHGAIGTTTLALILSERRKLRALKLDGKDPTAKHLAAGAYPYFKRLFLVAGSPRPAAANEFLAFVQSPAGRKVLQDTGHWLP